MENKGKKLSKLFPNFTVAGKDDPIYKSGLTMTSVQRPKQSTKGSPSGATEGTQTAPQIGQIKSHLIQTKKANPKKFPNSNNAGLGPLFEQIIEAYDALDDSNWSDEHNGFPATLIKKLLLPRTVNYLWTDCEIFGHYIDSAEIPFDDELIKTMRGDLDSLFGEERATEIFSNSRLELEQGLRLQRRWAQRSFSQGYSPPFCIRQIPRNDGKKLYALLMGKSGSNEEREVVEFYDSADSAIQYLMAHGYIDKLNC